MFLQVLCKLVMRLPVVLLMMLAAGCSGGAVVFAPTPLPPDLSPMRYEHPSGAFSVVVPRTWALYEQNTTTLATAAFSAPNRVEPALLFAAINVGDLTDSRTFGEYIDQYQREARPDILRYKEENRQAMGDGSWRITGLRTDATGKTQMVNTFIQRNQALFSVIEVIVPDDAAQQAELQQIVNSFSLNTDAPLQVSGLSALTFATPSTLNILHVSTWTTPDGVFFITGEVANYGGVLMTDIPVIATLRTADGLAVAQADDLVMGHGISAGGFAPFSLRFGQGQPSLTTQYELSLGLPEWMPQTDRQILDADHFSWQDESELLPDQRLVIEGTLQNIGGVSAQDVRAIVTVFDAQQRVIGAGFNATVPNALAPDESGVFQVIVPDLGATPANYIVTIQGIP